MTHELIHPGLILARRAGEVIIIELPTELGGHRLAVSCLQVGRGTVRLGLQCPRGCNIYRGEVRGIRVAPKPARGDET